MGPAFWTPLHFATYYRHAELVKILCEYNARYCISSIAFPIWLISSVDETNGENQTALHLACAGGWKEIIDILMTNGASVTKTDNNAKTPFERLSLKSMRCVTLRRGSFSL